MIKQKNKRHCHDRTRSDSTERALDRMARGHDEKGMALIGILLVITAMFALGMTASHMSRVGLRIAQNDLLSKKSMAVAEGGVDHAFSLLRADVTEGVNDGFDDELSSGGIGGSLQDLGSVASLGGQGYRFRSLGGGMSDGYYVRVADNFDEATGPNDPNSNADKLVKIISRGRVGGAERIVEAVVRASSLFSVAILGKDWLTFRGGSVLDSFDSSVGPYPNGSGDNADVASDGDIELKGNPTTINGGASSAGGIIDPGSGTITGAQTTGAASLPVYPVDPCGPPYSGGAGISGGSYDPITGALVATTDIVMDPGVYCLGSIVVGSGNTVGITGAVTIRLTGVAEFGSDSIVNPSNAADLQIFSSYAGADTGIDLAGGASVRAAVYAPEADIVMRGNASFTGAVVGKTVDVAGGVQLHYDEALEDMLGPGLQIVNWSDLRGF